jgi:ABC-type phosphate/phosphonate transport system substrate-binding protein
VEYFQLADLAEVEPVFWALGEGNAPPRWLLLVGTASGISSLEALRGRTATVYAKTGANLGQVWLDAMLYDRRLGRPDRFFRSVEVVAKASSAILPVFFGKADAAVVDEPSFDVSKEMNPQLGAKLRVLAASPPLAEGILCICRNRLEFREEFVQNMQELQRDPQGRQMLMVFRFSRLAPVDIPALAPVRELWRKHTLLIRPPEKALLGISSRQETRPNGKGEGP